MIDALGKSARRKIQIENKLLLANVPQRVVGKRGGEGGIEKATLNIESKKTRGECGRR